MSGADSGPPGGASRPQQPGGGCCRPLLQAPARLSNSFVLHLSIQRGPGQAAPGNWSAAYLGQGPSRSSLQDRSLAPRSPPPCPPATLVCSIWDDGTANPEPCLDQFTLISKYGALGWLLGGLSVFAVLGTAATLSAPEKRVPWVSAPACLQFAVITWPAYAWQQQHVWATGAAEVAAGADAEASNQPPLRHICLCWAHVCAGPEGGCRAARGCQLQRARLRPADLAPAGACGQVCHPLSGCLPLLLLWRARLAPLPLYLSLRHIFTRQFLLILLLAHTHSV